MSDDTSPLSVPPIMPSEPTQPVGSGAAVDFSPPTAVDLSSTTPPPAPPVIPPLPIEPAAVAPTLEPPVVEASAYGAPPTAEELRLAQAKADNLVKGIETPVEPVVPAPPSGDIPKPKKKLGKMVAAVGALGVLAVIGVGLFFTTQRTADKLASTDPTSKASGGVDGLCPDGRPANRCITYKCTQGDTNNDGQCNPADDSGVAVEPGSSDSCVYEGTCGQADIYAGGDDSSFCGTQGHNMSGCTGGGGGGGGGTPCTEEETCPGPGADGQTKVCGPTEDCIVRDGRGEGLPEDQWTWGCKADKACVQETPPPAAGLLCKNLRANPEAPTLGEAVRFICRSDGTKNVDHFEFRYKVDKGDWVSLPAGTAEGIEGEERQFRGTSDLTITQAGGYRIQCRVCKRADGNCTDWGKAH